jgi:hypothetical protein
MAVLLNLDLHSPSVAAGFRTELKARLVSEGKGLVETSKHQSSQALMVQKVEEAEDIRLPGG